MNTSINLPSELPPAEHVRQVNVVETQVLLETAAWTALVNPDLPCHLNKRSTSLLTHLLPDLILLPAKAKAATHKRQPFSIIEKTPDI